MALKCTVPNSFTVIDILLLLLSLLLLLLVVVLFVSELESISWWQWPGAKKQNKTFWGSFPLLTREWASLPSKLRLHVHVQHIQSICMNRIKIIVIMPTINMDTIMKMGPPGVRRLTGGSAHYSHLLLHIFLEEFAGCHEIGHTLFNISEGWVGDQGNGREWVTVEDKGGEDENGGKWKLNLETELRWGGCNEKRQCLEEKVQINVGTNVFNAHCVYRACSKVWWYPDFWPWSNENSPPTASNAAFSLSNTGGSCLWWSMMLTLFTVYLPLQSCNLS